MINGVNAFAFLNEFDFRHPTVFKPTPFSAPANLNIEPASPVSLASPVSPNMSDAENQDSNRSQPAIAGQKRKLDDSDEKRGGSAGSSSKIARL
jgi:hypothetical protein